MTRVLTAFAVLVALAAAACNGDGEAAETSSPTTTLDPPETTEPATTPEPTDPPTTTAAPTTMAPSTTLDVEALKAQIAADYERSWELRTELVKSPTVPDLSVALGRIAVPGSPNYEQLESFLSELVASGDRVVAGEPDYTRVEVEVVELIGEPPYTEATVTACFVNNLVRVDATGAPVLDDLVAVRGSAHSVLTPNGWLPDGMPTELWSGTEVTECPPA